MAIPDATGLTTDNLDQASDNPSRARSDLAVAVQKFRELLKSVDKAGGIVKLDADAQIEIARLFEVGNELKLAKVRGQGNVLSHSNKPETPVDVSAASGEAIKRVKIDAAGHVVRVEKGDITILNGPFYSEWYYSRYEEVSSASRTVRPGNFNSDILSWIPGFSKKLPLAATYFTSIGTGKILAGVEERAMANVKNASFLSATKLVSSSNPLQQGLTSRTYYYTLTIKPYRARYVYYKVS